MSHPRTQLQRVGGPDTEDNDRVRHPQTENDRNQKDTDETASWKRRDRPWFALLEFALSVEVPRGIADERDSADRTVTPTGNKTKMNGFVEISTLLIHSAPKQKSNEWMHLSPFYTRMHGEWLRYAKSTSQFHWRFLLVRDVRGFQVNPLCRHDITRSDRQIGNWCCVSRVGWRHDKTLNGEEKRGGGETDQYCLGNKVEKVIYLTLIRCLGSRAGPASLLLTFKPECTHKR